MIWKGLKARQMVGWGCAVSALSAHSLVCTSALQCSELNRWSLGLLTGTQAGSTIKYLIHTTVIHLFPFCKLCNKTLHFGVNHPRKSSRKHTTQMLTFCYIWWFYRSNTCAKGSKICTWFWCKTVQKTQIVHCNICNRWSIQFFLPSWIEQFDLTKFTIALSSAWVE